MPGTDGYPVLAKPVRAETEVSKSRFLAVLAPVDSEAAAHALVEEARAAHPEASHHCYAFVVGPPGSTRSVGYSDAGEPHNTAGRPMFDVLSHSGVGDVACVVTRWFGGTKLGRGGLVRAYGGAVQAALQKASFEEKVRWAHLRVRLDYAASGSVERRLLEVGAEIVEQRWEAEVELVLRVPEGNREQLEGLLADETRGGARVEEMSDD